MNQDANCTGEKMLLNGLLKMKELVSMESKIVILKKLKKKLPRPGKQYQNGVIFCLTLIQVRTQNKWVTYD